MMGDRARPPRCDNCGAEIPWLPVMHRGGCYCCGGCAQGGPCYCSYDLATKNWLRPVRRGAANTFTSNETTDQPR